MDAQQKAEERQRELEARHRFETRTEIDTDACIDAFVEGMMLNDHKRGPSWSWIREECIQDCGKYEEIRQMSDEDRRDIYQFALQRSREILDDMPKWQREYADEVIDSALDGSGVLHGTVHTDIAPLKRADRRKFGKKPRMLE